MVNTLEPGSPRIGFCWDRGMPDLYPAMLHDTGKVVELVVPYVDSEVLRRRFVGRSVAWGDDPEYEHHDYAVPEVVWFADSAGHMCLISPYRSRSTLIGRPDEGSTSFRFAVATGDSGTDYTRIHAVHSRLEGLNEWIQLGSVEHLREVLSDGAVRDVFNLQARPAVPITKQLNGQLEAWYLLKTTLSEFPRRIRFGCATDYNRSDNMSRCEASPENLAQLSRWRRLATLVG